MSSGQSTAMLISNKRKPLLVDYEPLMFGLIRWGNLNESLYGSIKHNLYWQSPVEILAKVKKNRKPYIRTKPRPPMSQETKFKISQAVLGRKHSEETKRKLSEIARNRVMSEETKEKIRASITGMHYKPRETKEEVEDERHDS